MSKVLKFSASYCNPCKQMDAQLDRLSDKTVCVVDHVDIDVSSELCKKYNIRSIPTLIKLSPLGEEIDRNIGSLSDEKLLEFLL